PRYFYDADAIREPAQQRIETDTPIRRIAEVNGNRYGGGDDGLGHNPGGANARSVWTIPTEPTPFAHFATWPQALVRRMILAGTSERGKCGVCGKPWVRDTEDQGYTKHRPSAGDDPR